ncbi:SID1 transmembrane family member 1-like isoform X1 [Osmia bicornis bicornis]|uniref:SID1 transmembrane family member 1-like isoform X1 n=1 Tax=Osmia bicornis bicornis TaxID=1437191 RepID=UPI0010F94F43|nr:SID1 transmembrane family member 1-like isoform X1 [Osmia bicornis bicornis]XP_046145977.1 SID1 transmembrane family member 1-like isoform X1 [Osmia bicornis bicornis]XP_046145978.1 SID1 transmembrane family member 1-like isoform X1 [Osmia bicornis bicornis]
MSNMQKILTVIGVLISIHLSTVISLMSLSFSPIVINGEYKTEYQLTINNTVEYVFLYPTNNVTVMETARLEVESNATTDVPLIVVVRQKKGILSWQIPLVVNSMYFNDLAYNKTDRTLCSPKYYQSEAENQDEFLTVSLSTGSHENILFKLNMTKVLHFYLSPGEKRSIEISPSQPIYYGYIFPGQEESSSVVVHVESDSDICMTVSIQNTSCPVFDLERNIEFSGYWQTVNRQGGITVPKEAYPLGFFVVLVVKGDDTDCYGAPSMIPVRNKKVTLTINTSITKQNYVIASATAVSVIFTFCIIYVISIVVTKIKEGRKIKQELLHQESESIAEPIPSPSMIEETGQQSVSIDEDSSLDEDDIDLMEDALSDKEVIRTKLVLSVCDLARKEPKILRHKSRLYLYYLITVAIFYTLPVVQLVITYQHVLHVTGNQDMCYYNFLCAHPFGLLSDFNHVFSNFGYIMLGLLFIFITYSREHNELDREKNKCYGIPQHYGLFYAMGTALIMEGILSGSYHVCPNRSNFQFDTSFMYIIAVLCMIKIYQTRHPDINARAPVTFGILALIIFIGLLGVLNGSIYFWILFTIMHLLICLFLTIQIYYMGRWRCRGSLTRAIQTCKYDARSGVRNLFRPLYLARFIMLVIANLCNVALAVVGNIRHEKNFATFLLAILMSNLILYTIFYIVMKICNKERILLQPLIFIILSMVFWAAAYYFFISKTISWALTPAQSRNYNRPCKLLNFFDNHDIWHFLSAFAMFFSFMVLLTLDDDLVDVHRSQIPVF